MVTAEDGFKMRQKGRGLEALSICMTSSVFGGLTSSLVLMFCAPLLASFALKFGPPEYFMLGVLGIATVLGMAGKNSWKHFLSMGFGLWLFLHRCKYLYRYDTFYLWCYEPYGWYPSGTSYDWSVWYPFCSENR